MNVSPGDEIRLILKAEIPSNKTLRLYKFSVKYDSTLASLVEAKKSAGSAFSGSINTNTPGVITLNGLSTYGVGGPASVSILDLRMKAGAGSGAFSLDPQVINFGYDGTDQFPPTPEKAVITIIIGCTPTAEICDGKDNDCDGQVDEGVKNTYYQDADGDGYGTPVHSLQACAAPSGYVTNNTDCDDTNKSIHQGCSTRQSAFWTNPSGQRISTLNVSPGDEIHLILKAEVPANKTLRLYKFTVTYNSTLASLVEARKPDGSAFSGSINTNTPGVITLNGLTTDGVAGPASVSILDLRLKAGAGSGAFSLDPQVINFGYDGQDQFPPTPEKAVITTIIGCTPTAEICDGKDNDCDGQIDEIPECAQCVEDSSGALDIEGAKGMKDQVVLIPVRIQSAANEVNPLGFEVLYDPTVLEYVDTVPGDLAKAFDYFSGHSNVAGKVIVAGLSYTGTGIHKGSSGSLLWLEFKVKGGQEDTCSSLRFGTLFDGFAHFSSSGGCFCIQQCDGDLNGDGFITPADALIIFKCFLGSGPCPDCADINGDGTVTPADALCLFQKFLGQRSCLD